MKKIDRRSFLSYALPAIPASMLAGSHISLLPFSQIRTERKEITGSVEAETTYGRVRGYTFNDVHIFLGIPYGASTSGKARFKPPSKPEKWKGVREATVNGARCIQGPDIITTSVLLGKYFTGGRGDAAELSKQRDSEDCLNVNVLTKGLTGKRPVMVYIHGGGFWAGSNVLTAFSDQFVNEEDVVLVGINHRLGVFGYLYLGGLDDTYKTGNPGQLDLIAALEWVRDNIANFGGDPSNVMIFGESGGGFKISCLLGMPAAKGLFHKASIQSGSMLHFFADSDSATKGTKDLMTRMGLSKVEELEKVQATDLFKAMGKNPLLFSPLIDGHSILNEPWTPEFLEISSGIPMIIGNDKDESSLFFLDRANLYELDDAGLHIELVKAGIPENKVDSLLTIYRRDHPDENPSELYFRISTDRGARLNAVTQAERLLARDGSKLFIYYCKWNTPLADGKFRSFHTSDLPLTMRLVLYPESQVLSKQLSSAWAAFARNSDPSQPGLAWPVYNTVHRATMLFDVPKSEVVNDPDRDERLMDVTIPSGALL